MRFKFLVFVYIDCCVNVLFVNPLFRYSLALIINQPKPTVVDNSAIGLTPAKIWQVLAFGYRTLSNTFSLICELRNLVTKGWSLHFMIHTWLIFHWLCEFACFILSFQIQTMKTHRHVSWLVVFMHVIGFVDWVAIT